MCDAFVTASVTEVHPLSVIEAMGAGLPVMGIHSPGVGDTVRRWHYWISLHQKPASLHRQADPSMPANPTPQENGRAARKASQQYDIERTTHMMLEHYERLASEPRPTSWIGTNACSVFWSVSTYERTKPKDWCLGRKRCCKIS